MRRHTLYTGSLLGLLLIAMSPTAPAAIEPLSGRGVAEADPAPPDTLAASASVGTPLILSLPPQVGDAPVSRYTILRGPSLSGVAGHSFTWITEGVDPDTYDVSLQANHPNAPPDTLVLQIEVQS